MVGATAEDNRMVGIEQGDPAAVEGGTRVVGQRLLNSEPVCVVGVVAGKVWEMAS